MTKRCEAHAPRTAGQPWAQLFAFEANSFV